MTTANIVEPVARQGLKSRWIREDLDTGLFQIRASAYTDPDLFEQEMRDIFGKSWLYAAHATELPQPGDFLRRKMVGRDMLLTRGKDGAARAFYNMCRHKGATICRQAKGNASRFSCVYHAWTYANDGKLIGVPGMDAYGSGFDKKDMGLIPVRMEEYRGLLFVCFDGSAPHLTDFLGGAAEALNLMLDAHGGEWQVLPQPYSYTMKANWKLVFENSLDAYHAMTLHGGFFNDFLPEVHGIRMTRDQVMGAGKYSSLSQLGRGHVGNEIKQFTPNLDTGKRERLASLHGDDHADRLLDYSRQMVVFPNLFIAEQFPFVRTYYPISVEETETVTWSFVPAADSEAARRGRISAFTSFQGPCGFASPDDIDVLEGCQDNMRHLPADIYIDASRGVLRSDAAQPEDEIASQVILREWSRRLEG
jgi:p-cumate 2,3-dioxygenase alpha subunit